LSELNNDYRCPECGLNIDSRESGRRDSEVDDVKQLIYVLSIPLLAMFSLISVSLILDGIQWGLRELKALVVSIVFNLLLKTMVYLSGQVNIQRLKAIICLDLSIVMLIGAVGPLFSPHMWGKAATEVNPVLSFTAIGCYLAIGGGVVASAWA